MALDSDRESHGLAESRYQSPLPHLPMTSGVSLRSLIRDEADRVATAREVQTYRRTTRRHQHAQEEIYISTVLEEISQHMAAEALRELAYNARVEAYRGSPRLQNPPRPRSPSPNTHRKNSALHLRIVHEE